MGLMKELNALNDIYQNMYTEDENKGYVVTAADKKGNTPAWKGYKAGKKNVKTGKPLYRAADHLKDDVEIEISPEVEKLIESGLFSDAEIAKITDIQEADIADIIARLEKKRISKGGNPDDSPLPAMKKYHADKKKKKVKEDYWMEFEEGYQRNPEKGEKEDRKYEKVRGERTPMPPRGNKRREEFERWYAANVR